MPYQTLLDSPSICFKSYKANLEEFLSEHIKYIEAYRNVEKQNIIDEINSDAKYEELLLDLEKKIIENSKLIDTQQQNIAHKNEQLKQETAKQSTINPTLKLPINIDYCINQIKRLQNLGKTDIRTKCENAYDIITLQLQIAITFKHMDLYLNFYCEAQHSVIEGDKESEIHEKAKKFNERLEREISRMRFDKEGFPSELKKIEEVQQLINRKKSDLASFNTIEQLLPLLTEQLEKSFPLEIETLQFNREKLKIEKLKTISPELLIGNINVNIKKIADIKRNIETLLDQHPEASITYFVPKTNYATDNSYTSRMNQLGWPFSINKPDTDKLWEIETLQLMHLLFLQRQWEFLQIQALDDKSEILNNIKQKLIEIDKKNVPSNDEEDSQLQLAIQLSYQENKKSNVTSQANLGEANIAILLFTYKSLLENDLLPAKAQDIEISRNTEKQAAMQHITDTAAYNNLISKIFHFINQNNRAITESERRITSKIAEIPASKPTQIDRLKSPIVMSYEAAQEKYQTVHAQAYSLLLNEKSTLPSDEYKQLIEELWSITTLQKQYLMILDHQLTYIEHQFSIIIQGDAAYYDIFTQACFTANQEAIKYRSNSSMPTSKKHKSEPVVTVENSVTSFFSKTNKDSCFTLLHPNANPELNYVLELATNLPKPPPP